MNDATFEGKQSGRYQRGLNKEREAVISAHFMHDINQNLNLKLYTPQEFSQRAIELNSQLLSEQLLPILLEASRKLSLERAVAAKTRSRINFKQYGLNSKEEVGIAEMITEVMFDRQFLKGSKANCSRMILVEQIRRLVNEQKPIKMIIPALPYKSSSPLKSRGAMPDLSEVNFLLGLVEIARTIDLLYRQEIKSANKTMAMFTVICDGRRFNHFLNEPDETIDQYQEQLGWWITKLQVSNYLEILDYQSVITGLLPKSMEIEKKAIKEEVRTFYTNLMLPLLNPYNMTDTISKAIELEPDPESCNPEGRFIPLFKSLIYIVNYAILANYVNLQERSYADLYIELTRHILEPYTVLAHEDFVQIETFLANPQVTEKPTEAHFFEYLRQSMLHEVWNATINYLAEIRSDRDLAVEPLISCFPDHIRWTIHAKPGQLAILTTTAFGDPVQPWHGVGVFKLTKNNKIKLYTLPILLLEGMGAYPVLVEENKPEYKLNEQPLFYIHPDIKFETSYEFIEKIKRYLTRKRKF